MLIRYHFRSKTLHKWKLRRDCYERRKKNYAQYKAFSGLPHCSQRIDSDFQ